MAVQAGSDLDRGIRMEGTTVAAAHSLLSEGAPTTLAALIIAAQSVHASAVRVPALVHCCSLAANASPVGDAVERVGCVLRGYGHYSNDSNGVRRRQARLTGARSGV